MEVNGQVSHWTWICVDCGCGLGTDKEIVGLCQNWNPGHQASILVTILCYPGSLRNVQFQSNFNSCEYLCYRVLLLYYSLLLLNNG